MLGSLARNPVGRGWLLAAQPSWRDGKSSSPRRTSGSDVPDWSQRRQRKSWDNRSTRLAALLGLLFGVPLLLLLWVLLFPDHRPTPLVIVSVPLYDSPIPPNAMAVEDKQSFIDLFGSYDNIQVISSESVPRTPSDLIASVRDLLARAEPGGPNKDVVLIYLSIHGVVDRSGRPCLLLPSSAPLDDTTWLPFAELLEVVEKSEGLEGAKKVLLLDSTRIEDCWHIGVMANTFSLAVDRLLTDSPARNCAVLNASSSLEVATAAPELHGTVFGRFVAYGLRGAADEAGNRDRVVSLDELQQYLATEVDAWTYAARGRHQHPKVLGKTLDRLEIVDVTGTTKPLRKTWKANVEVDQIEDVLQQLEAAEQKKCCQLDPTNWARAQFLLERLCSETTAGAAYNRMAQDRLAELKAVLQELERLQVYPRMQVASLAMEGQLPPEPAGKPVDLKALWQAWSQDPSKTVVPTATPGVPQFVWNALHDPATPLTQQTMEERLRFWDSSGKSGEFEWTELALARLLANWADWAAPAMQDNLAVNRLMEARSESEQLAAPADPQIGYFLRRLLGNLDVQQGVALDQLLSGDAESAYQANARLESLLADSRQDRGLTGQAETYAEVSQLSAAIASSLETRDKCLANALHFHRWICSQAKFDPRYRSLFDTTGFVRDANELSSEIAENIAAGNQNVSSLVRLAQRIQAENDRLSSYYQQRVASLLSEEGGSDAALRSEIPQILKCPLAHSRSRHRLQRRWFELLEGEVTVETARKEEDDISSDEADLAYLRWIAVDGAEPLRVIMERYCRQSGETSHLVQERLITEESTSTEAADALAKFEGSLRAALSQAPEICRQQAHKTESLLPSNPISSARRPLALADAMRRSMAAFTSDDNWFREADEPAVALRHLDTQALLFWQAQRAIDDCWGALRHSQVYSEPYFEIAARRLVEGAIKLQAGGGRSLIPALEVKQLNEQLEERRAELALWKPLSDSVLRRDTEGQQFQQHQFSFTGLPGISSGRASLYLTDEAGQLFPTFKPIATGQSGLLEQRRQCVSLDENVSLDQLMKPEDLGDMSVLYANVLFRGHHREARYSIGQGNTVVWENPPAAPASVVVRGDSKQVCQIVFIVDCSASMERKMTMADGSPREKLSIGAEVLSNLLDRLLEQNEPYRVGLMFYGRRAGWYAKGSDIKYLAGTSYTGTPGFDVEVAAEVQPLNAIFVQELREQLQSAGPLGETPLYYAIEQALLRRFNYNLAGPRHLIAITDGANRVDPLGNHSRPNTDKDAVLATINALRQEKGAVPKLDVIEFGGDGQGRSELQEIARATGGDFYEPSDSARLAEALNRSLRLDRYYLESITGGVARTKITDFGEMTQLLAPASPVDYDVRLEQHSTVAAKVRIEGGEALELYYRRPPDNRLEHQRYENELRQDVKVGGYYVAAHLPSITPGRFDETAFRVSIQNADESLFSRRPEVVWAKVTHQRQGDTKPYYFTDCQFEQGTPVPVLNFRTQGWPRDARANIELYFAAEADHLNWKLFEIPRIGEEQHKAYGATLKVTAETPDGSSLRVLVEEEHDENNDNYPLIVQLDPPPDRASRTYFDSANFVRHVFTYSTQGSRLRLRVLSRAELEAGGVGPVYLRGIDPSRN